MLLYEGVRLRKEYGGTLALDLPEFRLFRGEALVIEGANGSGKSTLLRLLAFLEKPTSGSLRFFGSDEPRRECTLLLQEPWLLHDSVFRNVTLGPRLRGKSADMQSLFCQAMLDAGFEDPHKFAKRKPFELSGGEKQRVALAARLAIKPTVLLLDEPTAYVDAKSGGQIAKALCKAHEEGMTIICATHDSSFARDLQAQKLTLAKPRAQCDSF